MAKPEILQCYFVWKTCYKSRRLNTHILLHLEHMAGPTVTNFNLKCEKMPRCVCVFLQTLKNTISKMSHNFFFIENFERELLSDSRSLYFFFLEKRVKLK